MCEMMLKIVIKEGQRKTPLSYPFNLLSKSWIITGVRMWINWYSHTLHITIRNVKWCGCFGEQSGGSSND